MLHRRAIVVLLFLILVQGLPVNAHANLIRSEPPANARLDIAPEELRLFFTEPLESGFSRIQIRNAQGDTLELPDAIVSGEDQTILTQQLEVLSDGVYTVAWRVVSQTDGHLTEGSFPITVGIASSNNAPMSNNANEAIPLASSVIRAINLLSLATLTGAIGFVVFVWYPSVPDGNPHIEKSMRRSIWLAWLSVGVASLLVLLLQTRIVSDGNLQYFMKGVLQVLITTRFGDLWMVRTGIWIIFGITLWRSPNISVRNSLLLLSLSATILITQSLFSHASGSLDANAAVVADWLHLLAMAIWIGGLIQFTVVIHQVKNLPNYLAVMVAHFSNMARLSVVMLVITGTYAAWLHIGSIEALLTTTYGQAMTIKFILFMPLLLIGAINLFFTNRGLQKGNMIWSKRLQGLVFTEIVFAIGIFGAVGVMTAISPARSTVAMREAVPQEPETNTFFEMAFEDDMMIHFSVEPGFVGENTFYVDLYDEDTFEVIDDASLIRLRFENEGNNLGESELRPELQGSRYIISGSNLSVAGDWRIRMTIQRPNEFDTVVDFEPTITLPQHPEIPEYNPNPERQNRAIALVVTGIMGMLTGVSFLFFQRPLALSPNIVLTIIFISGSAVIFQTGGQLLQSEPNVSTQLGDLNLTSMSISSESNYPWLLTQDGRVFRPDITGIWTDITPEGIYATSIYLEDVDTLWATADDGVYRYSGDLWESAASFLSENIAITHGYIFAMGTGGILRVPQGGIETDIRTLEVPEIASNAEQFEMLGNHSHILLNGGEVFLTSSLGLGWQNIDAPDDIQMIAIDNDGNLLAASGTDLLIWYWIDETWQHLALLPDHENLQKVIVFNDIIYIVLDDSIYRLQSGVWELVTIAENTRIVDLAFQYPDRLWVLDNTNNAMWFSTDGERWVTVPTELGE